MPSWIALYLIHLPILHAAFGPLADPADLPLPLPAFAALVAAVAVACSLAVFRWIERPLQRRLRRWLDPRRAGQNSAAQPIASVRGATGA